MAFPIWGDCVFDNCCDMLKLLQIFTHLWLGTTFFIVGIILLLEVNRFGKHLLKWLYTPNFLTEFTAEFISTRKNVIWNGMSMMLQPLPKPFPSQWNNQIRNYIHTMERTNKAYVPPHVSVFPTNKASSGTPHITNVIRNSRSVALEKKHCYSQCLN